MGYISKETKRAFQRAWKEKQRRADGIAARALKAAPVKERPKQDRRLPLRELDAHARTQFTNALTRLAEARQVTILNAFLLFCETRGLRPELMVPFLDDALKASIAAESKVRNATTEDLVDLDTFYFGQARDRSSVKVAKS